MPSAQQNEQLYQGQDDKREDLILRERAQPRKKIMPIAEAYTKANKGAKKYLN